MARAIQPNVSVDGELMVSLRDCTYDDKPRGRGGIGAVYHAIVRRDGRDVLACGAGFPIRGMEEPVGGLLQSEKCARSGCRQAFERAANAKEPT